MARRARCAVTAPRLEILETRSLLDAGAAGEVFVRFMPAAPPAVLQTALKTLGASVVRSYADGPTLLELGSGTDTARALSWLKANPYVRYAEPDATLHADAVVPNDPKFGRQWGLSNPNNVDIDAPQAWSITQGRFSVVVAVLDTGVDLNNPDLVRRLWHNPNPNAADGTPGDVFGWNFVSNTSNVQDNNGHGTHVTGILAASANNSYGIAGVDWNAKIMAVRVLDKNGDGDTDVAVSGIYYAVQHGARVINASWGGGDYSQTMHDAIAYAGAHGVVFVTAAGNESANSDFTSSYPGGYRLPNEIVVGAVNSAGRLADFSDYGARSVDLVAPGVDIVSTIPGGFASYSGTSMATPFVTGVVSLVLSVHPELNGQQVVRRILATTKPLPSLAGKTVTGGIVDAYNAVNFAGRISSSGGSTDFPATVTLTPDGSSDLDVVARILSTSDFYAGHGGTDTGFVTGLYQALLGRDPDPGGLANWVGKLQSGQTRSQVIQMLERSPEAYQTKVARWYQEFLGWNAPLDQLKTDSGVGYWADLLAKGQTDNTVIGRILSTNDFRTSHGSSNEGFVAGLYQVMLERLPDPGGLSYYVGLLQRGTSPQTVVQKFAASAEFKRVKVARWYQDLLGWNQPVGSLQYDSGVQYWARFLGNA